MRLPHFIIYSSLIRLGNISDFHLISATLDYIYSINSVLEIGTVDSFVPKPERGRIKLKKLPDARFKIQIFHMAEDLVHIMCIAYLSHNAIYILNVSFNFQAADCSELRSLYAEPLSTMIQHHQWSSRSRINLQLPLFLPHINLSLHNGIL